MLDSIRIEESRIRAAYARREDGDRYSLFQPGTLFIAQQIESDLLPERLVNARSSCSPAIRLQCGSAAELPFAAGTFDLVFQSTVFTSILDPDLKRRAAAEMIRVVTQDGIILWYDYRVNNPWNRDVRGVKRSEIKKLFPDCRMELQRMTLLPPLARWLAPYSILGCFALEKLPLLRTHYLGVIRKT
jgi:SAM-dependent methyltransferase